MVSFVNKIKKDDDYWDKNEENKEEQKEETKDYSGVQDYMLDDETLKQKALRERLLDGTNESNSSLASRPMMNRLGTMKDSTSNLSKNTYHVLDRYNSQNVSGGAKSGFFKGSALTK